MTFKKIIIILWLGFPRKEGDKKDCYQVFTKKLKMVSFLKVLIIYLQNAS